MATCPNCGSQVRDGAKFCQVCGSLLSQAAPAASKPAPTATSEPMVCPKCGAPRTSPKQKFCGKCGTRFELTPGGAAPQLASDAPQPAAPAPTTAAISADPGVTQLRPRAVPAAPQAQASTAPAAQPANVAASAQATAPVPEPGAPTSFTASSYTHAGGMNVQRIPLHNGFDANTVQFEGAGDSRMADAFSYFGKTYHPATKETADQPKILSRRSMDQSGKSAASMGKLDYGSRKSAGSRRADYAEFATQLSASVIPTEDLLTSDKRQKAARTEQQERLRHKVAMGELTKQEAVALDADPGETGGAN